MTTQTARRAEGATRTRGRPRGRPRRRIALRSAVPGAVAARRRGRPDPAGLRLTVRGQAVLVGATCAIATCASLLWGAAEPTVARDAPTAVVVRPGETLWDIATQIAPARDPRDVVDALVRVNGLHGPGDVMGGQRVAVPALP